MSTIETPDPIEWLRRHQPDPEPGDPGVPEDLLASILSGERTPSPTPLFTRRRRRAPWIAGGLGVVMVATAAFVLSHEREATNPTAVACMAGVDMSAERFGLLAFGGNPIDACRELWDTGQMGGAVRTTDQLTGCATDDGAAFVFPAGPEICEQLGLFELEFTPDEETERLSGLIQGLSERVNTQTCVGLDEAQAITTELLAEFELEGWTISVIAGPTPTEPCMTTGVDPENTTVYLSPLPPSDP